MSPFVTLPHPLRDGIDIALGSQVLAHDQNIVGVVNGNLEDINISASAGIQGTKLSNVAGSRIPFDRIEDDAVTFDKLRDHATDDTQRSVGTNHIKDLAVTTAKLAASAVETAKIGNLQVTGAKIADNTITGPKIKMGLWFQTISSGSLIDNGSMVLGTTIPLGAFPLASIIQVTVGAPAANEFLTQLHQASSGGAYQLVIKNVSGVSWSFLLNPRTFMVNFINPT